MTDQTPVPGGEPLLSEAVQATLPDVVPAPLPNTLTPLTELEIATIRKQIIEADGSFEKAGISLETMRRVLFTLRMKANPLAEQEAAAKPAKAAKEKKESLSTKQPTLKGDDVNSFLG